MSVEPQFTLSDVKDVEIKSYCYDGLSDDAKRYCIRMVEIHQYLNGGLDEEGVLRASLKYNGYDVGD